MLKHSRRQSGSINAITKEIDKAQRLNSDLFPDFSPDSSIKYVF